MRELDGAQDDKPGELNGYPGPFHNFNGITSPFGAHFILRVDKILMHWLTQSVNLAGNGALLWGVVLLHRAGFRAAEGSREPAPVL